MAKTLTSTVDPKQLVNDIVFRIGGKDAGHVIFGEVTTEATEGTATFDVKGRKQSTNFSQTKIEAIYDGELVAFVDIKVVIRKEFAILFPNIAPKPPGIAANRRVMTTQVNGVDMLEIQWPPNRSIQ